MHVNGKLGMCHQGLGENFGIRDSRGVIIALGITHQNIAYLSTTSRETVTRFLNKAAKAGEIEILANSYAAQATLTITDRKKMILRVTDGSSMPLMIRKTP